MIDTGRCVVYTCIPFARLEGLPVDNREHDVVVRAGHPVPLRKHAPHHHQGSVQVFPPRARSRHVPKTRAVRYDPLCLLPVNHDSFGYRRYMTCRWSACSGLYSARATHRVMHHVTHITKEQQQFMFDLVS